MMVFKCSIESFDEMTLKIVFRSNEPRREKTRFLHMRKQRRRSAAQ